jgi:GNAT superfamily N-acetyltransferase
VVNQYWPRVMEERREFQFHLLEGDEIVARACTIPTRWDGTLDDLPEGIDGALERGFAEDGANVLCALLIAIPRSHRRRQVSTDALRAMLDLARRHGLAPLIAPVRPTWKERYPLVPIERYAEWRREDGLPFDPWIRIHERFGGRILRPAPRSARTTGTVAEWEDWTGMPFPESGEYVFPGGLATVEIDREADVGRYWEPNVWMLHRVP